MAIREMPAGGGTAVVKYQHTDALGSPVAVTDSNRAVLERTEYEPYGRPANRAARNGMGYTGHVEDAATGMVYMQQRYYDPMLGVFLSVDPVTAYSNPVGQFHRYRYANNNPYRFTDPNGRLARGKEEERPPEPTPQEEKPEPTNLAAVTVVGIRSAPTPVSTPTPWLGVAGRAGSRLVGPASLFWPSPMGASSCEMPGGPLCGMMSELGETAPLDAPPGTLPLDKAKGKFGLDKDSVHGVKDAATGGLGSGKTWVGVAPDRTVGTNEGGRWTPQGTIDELKP
ncbi:RHS repeat-associated core domain-containing protein [Luteimonas sp. XNQY3]|nr:RHS repeat-associated core domain-containing protein [Luteimonas sp. XNQY3]